ncbi:acetyl-CoA C-acetyltransferase [Salvia divinorum]|uniref:Acetyl-CoA C-acetyltransferase n=1 Tax=Salvia divinorum TaxID=28513 RepID=A0ABD1G225_SALDI
MKATMLAAQTIKLTENDVVVAVGMESMSNAPKYILTGRSIRVLVWVYFESKNARASFKKDGGSVTASNASSISNGAAALVLVSGAMTVKLGLDVIARIRGYADAAQLL